MSVGDARRNLASEYLKAAHEYRRIASDPASRRLDRVLGVLFAIEVQLTRIANALEPKPPAYVVEPGPDGTTYRDPIRKEGTA